MGDRRQSRELALQALFSFDVNRSSAKDELEAFCAQRQDELTDSVKPFFLDIVEGVMASCKEIDSLLNKYSNSWKVSRMPVVDRNIMRIAAFELLKRPDIPPSVTINEAVEIGKKYGTRDSGPFINGILDQINLFIIGSV